MDITKVFGSDVFSEAVMKERLPKKVFKCLIKTIRGGDALDSTIADVVANAMKDWAIEKGATHYCHWFQPMTGHTAEKHDSFISPSGDGRTIMEFGGKELIQGEPDASSFPSGGLRATFEARGYTAWDCSSPVFIKEDGANTTLFIPCAFCSYTKHALDKKTPLLRSMEALNKQAMRVLKALGNTTSSRVGASLGSEQEYFLVDKKWAEKRLDYMLCGRTLYGAPAPKGQELDDQYFGSLHERIGTYMNNINEKLWKLGISAKTQHNEVAPAQYELAPIFTSCNQGTDWNQLIMEVMRDTALELGFVCSLHEKPFAGVNGSGKHNNWSICTDDGINLLDPGTTPHDNEVFLVFLCAVIRAVDNYQTLLRASVATTGNDHRLGANEAPPAILSIFLGEQLQDIMDQLAKGAASSSKYGGEIVLGASVLPPLPMDNTDRNRTSPFAFTGNKFEFRMVGSSQSTAGPNFVLNTIVAEVLDEVAAALEGASDVNAAAQAFCSKVANEHARILFNGDNYSQEWEDEAAKRGLSNIKNTVDSLATIMDEQNVKVFEKYGVLSKDELGARTEILFEQYAMNIGIEAKLTLTLGRRDILPAVIKYLGVLGAANSAAESKAVKANLDKVAKLVDAFDEKLTALATALEGAEVDDVEKTAANFRDAVIPAMNAARAVADELEMIVDAALWPLPTYAQMLHLR